MALQRATPLRSLPVRDKQGFYGVIPTGLVSRTSRITSKPTFLDPGLTISEPVDCTIFKRSEDAEPRVMSNSMFDTYMEGRPTMEDGWSAHSGLNRLISDSEGRFVASVMPWAWDAWVSELGQDTRTLLPGYFLTHAIGYYVRYNKQGRIVAAVDRFTWKDRRDEWKAKGAIVHLPKNVVCVWQGSRKVAVFDRTEWTKAKSQYMKTPAVAAGRPELRRMSSGQASTTTSGRTSLSGASMKSHG